MWEHAWSTARFHLGLSDEEFFRLTPRQLGLLKRRRDERLEHQELLSGIIAATIANHSFAPPREPFGPGEFMPSQWREKERRKQHETNQAQVADQVRHAMNILMGEG